MQRLDGLRRLGTHLVLLVERVAHLGAHDVLVNAGGDIAARCARTDTPDWTIGIEDPRDRSRMLRAFGLRIGAVATSGSAARGGHLIDPATGGPATWWLSATVIGPELTWAGVYATAAFVKPDAPAWLTSLEGHAGLLLDPAGVVTGTGLTGPGRTLR